MCDMVKKKFSSLQHSLHVKKSLFDLYFAILDLSEVFFSSLYVSYSYIKFAEIRLNKTKSSFVFDID